ncbi:MAG: ATPase [Gammaproteobacteria bacterium]|nr:ATPase [Gammaproteobacteria bacterium]
MFWLIAMMTSVVLITIALGFYYELRPLPLASPRVAPRLLKGTLGVNVLVFAGGLLALLFLGVQEVMAESAGAEGVAREISMGLGLAIIGIGIPTAGATLGAGLAVGPIGAAALAVVVEKPEAFGRSLIYIGLAEGIAIYGLVVSILLMDKI